MNVHFHILHYNVMHKLIEKPYINGISQKCNISASLEITPET